jgi:MSHA biogenesis protein MshL
MAIGQASGYSGNPLITNGNGLPTLGSTAGQALLANNVALPNATSGILGLSLATKGFEAVLGFLETHGAVQVLSSPRIAAMNNQKAVLKVGSDEFFVTAVQGGSVASGNNNNNGGTTTLPTITLTPFFSGIALDVTPQIDDGGMITLHIHPSVTAVSTVTKQIDLGAVGNYKLPLAYSSVNETDTVVRIPNGNIAAIGGLMQMETNKSRSGLPGSSQNVVTSTLFGNRIESSHKKEIVVLIKPTVIQTADDWQAAAMQVRDTLDQMDHEQRRIVRLDGGVEIDPPHAHASN